VYSGLVASEEAFRVFLPSLTLSPSPLLLLKIRLNVSIYSPMIILVILAIDLG